MQLAALVRTGDSSLDDFAELLHPSASHGDEARRLIESSIKFLPTETGKRFFESLLDLHDNTDSQKWTVTMGDLVECTFVALLRSKYEAIPGAELHHECHVTIDLSGRAVSLGGQSVDAVAWHNAQFCGELLEAKKDISANDSPSFVRKLKKLIAIDGHLKANSGNDSFVGVVTLAVSQRAEAFLAALLGDPEVPMQLELVTASTVDSWLARRYMQ